MKSGCLPALPVRAPWPSGTAGRACRDSIEAAECRSHQVCPSAVAVGSSRRVARPSSAVIRLAPPGERGSTFPAPSSVDDAGFAESVWQSAGHGDPAPPTEASEDHLFLEGRVKKKKTRPKRPGLPGVGPSCAERASLPFRRRAERTGLSREQVRRRPGLRDAAPFVPLPSGTARTCQDRAERGIHRLPPGLCQAAPGSFYQGWGFGEGFQQALPHHSLPGAVPLFRLRI